jgi:hypothetical protein
MVINFYNINKWGSGGTTCGLKRGTYLDEKIQACDVALLCVVNLAHDAVSPLRVGGEGW